MERELESLLEHCLYNNNQENVNPNLICRKIIKSSNLIHVSVNPEVNSKTVSCSSHFVPAILLSNTMSLAPKIDEIAVFLTSNHIDIAFFSETWLKESVPDDAINITNYQLFRRDRQHKSHGGVCFYSNNTISCNRLTELDSDNHEVLWLVLQPKRLPRNYSNMIIAVCTTLQMPIVQVCVTMSNLH